VPQLTGADHAALPILRITPGDPKIFVQADIGLPEPALFLVDTGASISVISPDAARALGLQPEPQQGVLEGVGGSVAWSAVRVPDLRLGDMTLHDVAAAVDVRGVPRTAGFMDLAGVLGNNVWAKFVVSIDFPADRIDLWKPGTENLQGLSEPLVFDGFHAFTVVDLVAGPASDPSQVIKDSVPLAIDTGARGVLLTGDHGLSFASIVSQGEESIYGIAAEDLPPNSFMHVTRRIPLTTIHAGGRDLPVTESAQWVNYDRASMSVPEGLPGLLGSSLLEKNRLVLDYQGGRVQITDSAGPPSARDGHEVVLEQDILRHGDDPDRGFYRAKLFAWLDRYPEALGAVNAWLGRHPGDAEAVILKARVHKAMGDLDGYWQDLSAVTTADLLAHEELLASVNGHLLAGRPERARMLASEAVTVQKDSAEAWLALADVRLSESDFAGTRAALAEADRIEENPDGYLLRRARLALAEGDRVAALAHVRRLLELYPLSGFSLWFYTALAQTPEERAMLKADLERAVSRVHREDVPRDFAMHAWRVLGETQKAKDLLAEGLQEDCATLDKPPSKANCEAWYSGLAGVDLDRALDLSRQANVAAPNRSDYLDTLALLLHERGDLDGALEKATMAARLSSEDIYLLWQVDRLEAEVAAKKAVVPAPPAPVASPKKAPAKKK